MGVEQWLSFSTRVFSLVTNGFSRTTHEKFISKYISFTLRMYKTFENFFFTNEYTTVEGD